MVAARAQQVAIRVELVLPQVFATRQMSKATKHKNTPLTMRDEMFSSGPSFARERNGFGESVVGAERDLFEEEALG